MTDAPDVRALLAALVPPPKQRSSKWAKVEEYLGDIYAARDRGVPWALIAQTLKVAGIDVSAVDLRVFVSKIIRDPDKYPQPKGTRRRKKMIRQSGSSRTKKRRVATLAKPPVDGASAPGSTDEARAVDARPLPGKASNDAPAASKPIDYAGIRRMNARK
jgi:hypothetical protein